LPSADASIRSPTLRLSSGGGASEKIHDRKSKTFPHVGTEQLVPHCGDGVAAELLFMFEFIFRLLLRLPRLFEFRFMFEFMFMFEFEFMFMLSPVFMFVLREFMFSLVVVAPLFVLPFLLPFLLPLPHLKKASMANISNIAGIKRMIPLLE
jgi:hypothetical protein